MKESKSLFDIEPVALLGGIGAIIEALTALILASQTDLSPESIGMIMMAIVGIVSALQMILERSKVTPVTTPRKKDPNGNMMPLFPKETPVEEKEKGGGEETREPVMLINSLIMIIELVIPLAMALGLLSQEQTDSANSIIESLKSLTSSLMALVMTIGDFAAVLMIRNQVTPVADPRDMKGEPLTP